MANKPSYAWYLLPIFLGIIGGVIGYYILKNKHDKMAKYMLFLGIVSSIFGIIINYFFTYIPYENKTMELRPATYYYWGYKNYTGPISSVTWRINIEASSGIDFYIVKTESDVEKAIKGETFTYYEKCYEPHIMRKEITCTVLPDAFILLYNPNEHDVRVDIKAAYSVDTT